ncbi:MAG: Rpn family recombination-promoting nuclease/putative transposase, partial [Oscillospiraceae bacterium]|nr:Rpn family recombination-promoting nuclease/putative transposase [Oscillospiraceae bacterium]
MLKSLLPPKSDFVFKRIFGDVRNTDILTDFLQSVLELPAEDYEEVSVVDPHLNKDSGEDKYGILDVKVRTKTGKIIDVEIQRRDFPNIEERILFYTSKMLLGQIGSGDDYRKIKQVISILITNYELYKDERYHHRFKLRDDETGILFTRLLEVNTLELPKLPALPSDDDRTKLYEWLRFIKVENREELEMIATANPKIKKAKGVLLKMSADEQARLLYESYEMRELDEMTRTNHAYSKGIAEGIVNTAVNMLEANFPFEMIVQATKLSVEEVESVRLQWIISR